MPTEMTASSFGWLRFATALLLTCTAPATVARADETQAQPPPWPVKLRTDLARVGEVEWRLRQAAGAQCPNQSSGTGITFDDRRAYARSDWPLLADTLGLGPEPVVAAVATDSPAARAGIKAGDVVVAIDRQSAVSIAPPEKVGDLVADALADFVASRPAARPIEFGLVRDGQSLTMQVKPEQVCSARFMLVTKSSLDAHSDGKNVAISTGFVNFALSNDELALVAGHELGHIIHRDGKAASLADRRNMEDRADEAGAHLAKCAGYDVAAALGFWDRYADRRKLSFLYGPSHRSPRDRAARMAAFTAGDRCDAQPAAAP